MKNLIMLTSFIFCGVAYGSTDLPGGLILSPEATVKELAQKRVSADFKTEVRLVKNTNLCGGHGDAYLVDVKMRKMERSLCYMVDENDKMMEFPEPCLKSKWVVVKSYGILASDLSDNPQLMDSEACLE